MLEVGEARRGRVYAKGLVARPGAELADLVVGLAGVVQVEDRAGRQGQRTPGDGDLGQQAVVAQSHDRLRRGLAPMESRGGRDA